MYVFFLFGIYSQFYEKTSHDTRSDEVRDAFLHAWKGYKTFAYGSDEVRPLTNLTKNDKFQGWGATLVDSLSTLWIMDLKTEFYEAVKLVNKIDFSKSEGFVLVFETIIRYLGGLISAYDLSKEEILKTKAIQLADALLPAFDSDYGLPYYSINFNTGKKNSNNDTVVLAEAGSIQLEFYRLSQITNDLKYYFVASRIFDHLDMLKKPTTGLYPLYLDIKTGDFISKEISFGALGDSFYEYLIKLYIMTKDKKYHEMFKQSIIGLKKLIRRDSKDNLYFGIINKNGKFEQTMDHLSFVVPAILTLGATVTPDSDYFSLATKLIEPCVGFYSNSKTKLGPEVIDFYGNKKFTNRVATNNLRPELFESLFYLYKFSKNNKIYQDYAYEIFKALLRFSKTGTAFAGYKNVDSLNVNKNQVDSMESFFTAETMTYLYLIFKPRDFLDLNTWVFNTEAHPLRINTNKDN